MKHISDVVGECRAAGKSPGGTFSAKCIFVGNGSVGKTSLSHRFVDGAFEEEYISTIGTNILKKTQEVGGGRSKVNWVIWDIGGQEAMAFIRKRFYDGTNAMFLVFDLTAPITLEHLESKWLPEIRNAGLDLSAIPKVLVGNKCDLVDERQVAPGEIEAFAEKHDFQYIETSAKTGENVDVSFEFLAYKYLEFPERQ